VSGSRLLFHPAHPGPGSNGVRGEFRTVETAVYKLSRREAARLRGERQICWAHLIRKPASFAEERGPSANSAQICFSGRS
jgi:hypothetical protein